MAKPDRDVAIQSALADIKADLKLIDARLLALETKPEVKEPEKKVVAASVVESKFPIPFEFRDAVEDILNKAFGIEIHYQSDNAAFQFDIIVPEQYSNAGKPHWETYKEDRRSKVIMNQLGVAGVREWAQKVYDNLSPEVKAQVTIDRPNL